MATSLKIGGGLKSRVQQLASQRRRPAHWIMLEAIQQYVDREEAQESFKQEALASWETYKETGRHLTSQEVRTWLNSWAPMTKERCLSATSNRHRGCGCQCRVNFPVLGSIAPVPTAAAGLGRCRHSYPRKPWKLPGEPAKLSSGNSCSWKGRRT